MESGWAASVLAPVFLLGFLIFIHELGHFLFAKAFGVGVEQFSFGFGPRLWGIEVGGTDYRLNVIPLGGYVKMVGDDPFEEPDLTRDDSFMNKGVWQRLSIAMAGPAFNLILPIFLFASVYMAGSPESIAWVGTLDGSSNAANVLQRGDRIVAVQGEPIKFWSELVDEVQGLGQAGEVAVTVEREGAQLELAVPVRASERAEEGTFSPAFDFSPTAVLPYVAVLPESPAAEAGLKSGDLITAVNGEAVRWWYEVEEHLSSGDALTLSVERLPEKEGVTENESTEVTLAAAGLELSWVGDDPPPAFIGAQGEGLLSSHSSMAYGLIPRELHLIEVPETMPAWAAGVRPDDVVVGIGERAILSWAQIVKRVGDTTEGAVDFTILRGRELHWISVVPEIQEQVTRTGDTVRSAKVGISSGATIESRTEPMRLGVLPALSKGFSETVLMVGTTVRILTRIFTGHIPMQDAIGGPIAIVRVAQESASVSIFRYFKVMALISISLGLMNLLPIPLLDGGHILFFSIEAIRGRPVSLRFREVSHQVGLIFLLTLIVFVIINDTRLHILN